MMDMMMDQENQTRQARTIMRAAGLHVRPRGDWAREVARRDRVKMRAAYIATADAAVAAAACAVLRESAAVAAIEAALDAVQRRASLRLLRVADVAQAVHETLDTMDDGYGTISAPHQVAGCYGYAVSYTYAHAQWCSTGVLITIGRNASTARGQCVLIAHSTARTLRRALVRGAVETLPAAMAAVMVTREDSMAAGNCARVTDQAIAALGVPAPAPAIMRWVAEQGISTTYAMRAIRAAHARMQRTT